ncbi:MAG: hypothetical protein CM15mV20_3250 [uncultured marine virus]|nr:MAG: hypothetical protein CM15mV20_3250 [uncultured marine virus]
MINDLTKQLDALKNELLDMERTFTMKKGTVFKNTRCIRSTKCSKSKQF